MYNESTLFIIELEQSLPFVHLSSEQSLYSLFFQSLQNNLIMHNLLIRSDEEVHS